MCAYVYIYLSYVLFILQPVDMNVVPQGSKADQLLGSWMDVVSTHALRIVYCLFLYVSVLILFIIVCISVHTLKIWQKAKFYYYLVKRI